jgi:ribosomal protein RSM22 (predicted rRNA methylase)
VSTTIQPNQTIKSPPKVNIKQFNSLEAERQSAASRINKKMARKTQVCNTELRKVQKAEYQVPARLESVKKQWGRK